MEALIEQDWRRLIQMIRRGTCILMLGPGVAVSPRTGEGIPLTAALARSLAGQLAEEEVCEVENLAHVAQIFCQQRDVSRIDLEMAVRDFYQPFQAETPPLHLALAKLPFTLCVNTSFDNFLVNAFRACNKDPKYDYYHFRRLDRQSSFDKQDPGLLRDPRYPIVYNLYGSCEDETSFVLTENDLLTFLVKAITRSPPLPEFMKARFKDPDASFLFLGFGFQRWYMRILLHVLEVHSHQNPSLAMEDARFFTHPEREQILFFFQREHRIQFRQHDWDKFAIELQQRYEASVASTSHESAPDLPADAPTVFLCHCSEDKDRVEELGRELQRHGVGIWLDRQNLRGGDKWEIVIPSLIKNRVDYVLVVQSEAMATRGESYFYSEIKEALRRQELFAQRFRFLIPVQLQAGCFLDELRHLHSEALTDPDSIRKLAQTILDDWKREGRREKIHER